MATSRRPRVRCFTASSRRRASAARCSMSACASRVVAVKKRRRHGTGATLVFATARTQDIACKVLIDATEYGDVIPLTGARYRVGNSTSDKVDPAALVQDHTWTCVVREYPDGVPEHLQIKEPPPGYETGSGKRYRKFTNDGMMLWGGAGKGIKGDRHWRVFFAWRGMVDTDSPLTGHAQRAAAHAVRIQWRQRLSRHRRHHRRPRAASAAMSATASTRPSARSITSSTSSA